MIDDPLAALVRGLESAWKADALCKEHPTVNFFPERGEDASEARDICSRCMVQSECLTAAIENEERGVWAGTSERERQRLRRAQAGPT